MDPKKIGTLGDRKIVEVVNDNIRILYVKIPLPPPFLPRSSVFSEIVKDIEFDDGRKATLICGKAVIHDSMPGDPTKDVRIKNFLICDYYEELEVGDNPVTRWTSLVASSPQLPVGMNILAKNTSNKVFEKKVEYTANRYIRDDTNEHIIYEIEEENAEKLDIGNTLLKVFVGSKLFLFSLPVS